MELCCLRHRQCAAYQNVHLFAASLPPRSLANLVRYYSTFVFELVSYYVNDHKHAIVSAMKKKRRDFFLIIPRFPGFCTGAENRRLKIEKVLFRQGFCGGKRQCAKSKAEASSDAGHKKHVRASGEALRSYSGSFFVRLVVNPVIFPGSAYG